MNNLHYRFIDLFCGAGGFSYGFESAGFINILAVDNNPKFKKTFNSNHKNPVFKNIEISLESVEKFKDIKVDVILGSPPCQGFSHARGNRTPEKRDQKERNMLIFPFIKIVEFLQPKIALIENVKGMLTYRTNKKLLTELIVEKFDDINYKCCFQILNTKDFGVPQCRERIFFLAINKEFNINHNIIELLFFKNPKHPNTILREAISDLPLKTNYDNMAYIKNFENCSEYQKIMRKKKNSKIFNHIVVSNPNDFELKLIKNIPQGKLYRSSRFGKKYIGVWNLFKNQLKQDEMELLHFLCKKRTLNDFKELKKKYQEGFIREEKFSINNTGEFDWEEEYPKKNKNQNQNRTPKEIINSLLKKNWLRSKEFSFKNTKYLAYDINTKSGIRPKYRRLSYNEPSVTILTISFNVKELIHPIANRALSLREGARIQSFPDDFIFYGNNKDISTMIGNAVPPLMALGLAKKIKLLLQIIENQNFNFQNTEKYVTI